MDNLLKIYTERKNNIFQSKVWQQYQEAQGSKTWSISCDEEETLVIKKPLYGQKSYLYVPHGPLTSTEGWHVFLKKTKEIAQEENAVFLRIEPLRVPNGTLKDLRFRKVTEHSPLSHQLSPVNTLLLDLELSEEELLAKMKPKGRYNIRLAERKGIKVRQSQKMADLKVFHQLSLEMKERGFSAFDLEHYKKMLATLAPSENIELFVAEHKKDILSCLLVLFYNDVAIYLHGASGNEKRELMPNHLAQWKAILEAKKRGCRVYDFWGIAPNEDQNHPWVGITRFKKSFGGEEVQFLGAYDFTFQPVWYKMFILLKIFKKAFGK
jgi:peptidoglycan pentaglycine glycine transferase (the first glycine)